MHPRVAFRGSEAQELAGTEYINHWTWDILCLPCAQETTVQVDISCYWLQILAFAIPDSLRFCFRLCM